MAEVITLPAQNITKSSARIWGKVLYIWPDSEGYLYNEGEHEHMWVPGASQGSGSQSKQASRMVLDVADSSGTAYRTWVTDKKVDLSEFNTLAIDWWGIGDDYNEVRSRIIVDDSKTSFIGPNSSFRTLYGSFSRRNTGLDISGINESKWVKVQALDWFLHGIVYNTVFIYRLWLY